MKKAAAQSFQSLFTAAESFAADILFSKRVFCVNNSKLLIDLLWEKVILVFTNGTSWQIPWSFYKNLLVSSI